MGFDGIASIGALPVASSQRPLRPFVAPLPFATVMVTGSVHAPPGVPYAYVDLNDTVLAGCISSS